MNTITVIYDGECEFCLWSIEWLKNRDKNSLLRYLPCQSEARRKEFPGMSESQCLGALQVASVDGTLRSGFDGIAYIMRFLPGLKFLGVIFRFPGVSALGRLGYRWIAKNRYHIKCDDNRCHS